MHAFRIVLLVWFCSLSCAAAPYKPNSDAEVLETLPMRTQAWSAFEALQRRHADHPDDLQAALNLARRAIELGREEADPRYFGYAEAALGPWLQTHRPAPEVLVLQATLYQNRHAFPQALAMLDRALRRQPRSAQAWLTRAVVLEVQGDYASALNSCRPLLRLSPGLTAAVCIDSALSLSGHLDSAYNHLNSAVQIFRREPASTRQWALVALAEMAERQGAHSRAGQHYRDAAALGLRNAYLLAAYTDFLIDRERFEAVLPLLKDEIRQNGLLLRLTLAEQALHSDKTEAHIEMLKARFADSRLRGDIQHQGDEARFALHLLRQPEQALKLALNNWALQKEPRDARILLESALACKQDAVLQAVERSIKTAKLEDVRLTRLIARGENL